MTHELINLYHYSLKPSLDFFSRDYIRRIICILDDLFRSVTGTPDWAQSPSDALSIEAECANVNQRMLGFCRKIGALKIPKTVVQAIVYLFANYGREISLEDTSRELSVNKIYLSRIFHAKTSVTFLELLQYVRLEVASFLLSETDQLISQIALRVGYADAHYFGRLFKKKYGLSPEEYRKSTKVSEVGDESALDKARG